MLVNELNHRVKNMLAIIQSIAQQSFKGNEMAASRAAFEGRLVALSAAHYILNETTQNSASLRHVIAAAVRPFYTEGDRLSICGPDLALPAGTAVALSMAVHELATNATKYGALSNNDGQVSIRWTINDEPRRRMNLVWGETNGPSVVKPSRRGFGSRMIERVLASELNGSVTVDFRPEGLVCSVEAPIASGT